MSDKSFKNIGVNLSNKDNVKCPQCDGPCEETTSVRHAGPYHIEHIHKYRSTHDELMAAANKEWVRGTKDACRAAKDAEVVLNQRITDLETENERQSDHFASVLAELEAENERLRK